MSIHNTTPWYFNPLKQGFPTEAEARHFFLVLGQEALRIYLSLPQVLQQLEFDAAIFSPFYTFRGIRTWVWMLTQFHCWFHWGFDVVVFGRLELRSFGKKKHN